MAASAAHSDYFASRPAVRTRPSGSYAPGAATQGSPRSPRTPLLGRSISSGFGSPGGFRAEPEDHVVYELGARHFSAGFAGESRPRCVLKFDLDSATRVGDYRAYEPGHNSRRRRQKGISWGQEHELYKTDLRNLELGLVEDKLERAVRKAYSEFLQMDSKVRKAVLAVPSLLPTPLLDLALKVIFNHSPQPPSITILTTPVLACAGAGLRHALVIDVGWEETVITVVGEYKEIIQRRSVRAGKMLTEEMSKTLDREIKGDAQSTESVVDFETAEEVTERMAWCRQRSPATKDERKTKVEIPLPLDDPTSVSVPFERLADPAENVLFGGSMSLSDQDDHELPIHQLAHRVLLAVPLELRAIVISRIVLTGGVGKLPGLKRRLLDEMEHLADNRGWDPVHSYGSADAEQTGKKLSRMSLQNGEPTTPTEEDRPQIAFSPAKKPIQDAIPHSQRLHDDIKDPITLKAERETRKSQQEVLQGMVRGVETVGAWAAASLVAGLRVKGVHEVEREEFQKHGHWEGGAVI